MSGGGTGYMVGGASVGIPVHHSRFTFYIYLILGEISLSSQKGLVPTTSGLTD